MNKVIIPDEKVRIKIRGTHLLVMFLYKYGVKVIEMMTRHTAIEIGFIIDIIIVASITVITIFPFCF